MSQGIWGQLLQGVGYLPPETYCYCGITLALVKPRGNEKARSYAGFWTS